jgi:hypothetical protein
MKKLTYVTPEIEYAIIANDILTESFEDTDHFVGEDVEPEQ